MTQHAKGKTHLIVGDGITALAFLENYQGEAAGEIVVLGRSASQLGRGAAYAKGTPETPWRFAYLLNSPADDIDPRFAQWLAKHWPEVREKMANRSSNWLAAAAPLIEAGDLFGVNAPREFYGDFMEERAAAAIAQLAGRGIGVTCIDDTAISVAVTPEGVNVGTASGAGIQAQTVDVAPGGPSAMRIEGDDEAFSAPSVFGNEERIAEHVKRGAEIFCIGGNAAMLDVLRLCQSLIPEDRLRFVAGAPDGEVPAALVPRLPRKLTQPELSEGHTHADRFLAEVWQEIERAKANGDDMREIRAGVRAHLLENPLTKYISEPSEAQKVPGKLRLWLRGGTRDTISDMHRLIADGRARIVKGLVKSVACTTDGAVVTTLDEDGNRVRHSTGFVVNCAGAGPNSNYDPLTQDMLRQGLISICQTSGGLMVKAGCQTQSPRMRYLSPAVSQIGDEVVAMPLYDAHMLRSYVALATAR